MRNASRERRRYATPLYLFGCVPLSAWAALDGLSDDSTTGIFQLALVSLIVSAPIWGAILLLIFVAVVIRAIRSAGRTPETVNGRFATTDQGRRWYYLFVALLIGLICAILLRPQISQWAATRKALAEQDIRYEKAVQRQEVAANHFDKINETRRRNPFPPVTQMNADTFVSALSSAAPSIPQPAIGKCSIVVWDRNAHRTYSKDTPVLMYIYVAQNTWLSAYARLSDGEALVGDIEPKVEYGDGILGALRSQVPYVATIYFPRGIDARIRITSKADCTSDGSACTVKGELLDSAYSSIGLFQQCPPGARATLLPRALHR